MERDELPRIERELDKLMKLILASDDIDASKRVMKQMKELETRKEDLEKALAEAVEPPPLLHAHSDDGDRSFRRMATTYSDR